LSVVNLKIEIKCKEEKTSVSLDQAREERREMDVDTHSIVSIDLWSESSRRSVSVSKKKSESGGGRVEREEERT